MDLTTTTKYKEIQKEALQLSNKERARLAENLLVTLDAGQDVDSESDWLDEAERRYQEYRAGKIEAIPSKEVFEKAFQQLK